MWPDSNSSLYKNSKLSIICVLQGCWFACAGAGWSASSSPLPVSLLELSEGDRIPSTSSLLK